MKQVFLCASAIVVVLAGCASNKAPGDASVALPAPRSIQLATTDVPDAPRPGDVPPNAKPGECYARVVIAPQYRDEQETVLLKAASESFEVVPAQFKDVDQSVLVRPAGVRLEVVPAEYETVTERVQVKPASTRIEQVPATYETVSERVLIKPAQFVWKRGSSADGAVGVTRIDEATGDLMCLVEVPAEYSTVTKEVVMAPASTREVVVPAEYATVEKQIVKRPAATREVQVPAEYKTMKTTEIVQPARSERKAIAAQYQTVTKRVMVAEGRTEWRSVLCQTNTTTDRIANIQESLGKAGFAPGRTDGVMIEQTFKAIQAFQGARNLPVDNGRYINVDTVRALGVSPN